MNNRYGGLALSTFITMFGVDNHAKVGKHKPIPFYLENYDKINVIK